MSEMDAGVGKRIQERRARLGMSVAALAKVAKVDRSRLTRLEAGDESVTVRVIGKIEAALDRLEDEMGMGDPRPIGDPADNLIEFTIEGTGVRAVVKGPIANLAELQAAAAKLVREMQTDVPLSEDSGISARVVGGE